MKCRKCGHLIQVSSVAGVGDAIMGSEPPSAIDTSSQIASEPPEPQASAPKSEPKPAPNVAAKPEPKKAAPAPTRAAVAKPAPKPAPAAAARGPLPAPKAPPARSSPTKPSAPSKPSSPTTAAAPAPSAVKSDKKTNQGGASAPLPRVAPVPVKQAAAKPAAAVANALSDFDAEDESTRIADSSALAGAFSLAVGAASGETPAPDALSMPADEWFVGINGVPVGPIRLSELRSKAASGSVTRESLVWRDGFEDWRPLKTFPELLAIVDESVSSARASLTPFTPSVATAAPAAGALSDPFALATGAAIRTPEPFAGAPSGVTGTAVVTDDLEAAGIKKRAGSSPAAWIAVAIALLFGLTLGFVFFNNKQKPVEVIKYVDRVVPGAPSAAA
ncbi:MAG TPA: GYF domain-containing protein, partial [Polyangiaceae bacterium]|nr:GYF domain-containing protein [Polyangiaceae bacterium]